jgi:PAS domain S-box-containing protein
MIARPENVSGVLFIEAERKKQAAGKQKVAGRSGDNAVKSGAEKLYREIVEGADDLIVRVDGNGRVVYANRASGKILGIGPEELVGRVVSDLIHPDDLRSTAEAYSKMKRDGVSCIALENRWMARAGDVRHISWTVNRHVDNAGSTAVINAIGKDVTRLRQSEEALRRRETDFRTILSGNADGVIVLDGDGYVLYVNPAAETLFDIPAAEMAGRNFGFPIVLDQPVGMYVLREFQSFVAVEMRLNEVEWEGKPSFLISFRDLTDRIIAEQTMRQVRDELEAEIFKRVGELSALNERLLEREADLVGLFDAINESAFLMEPDGTIIAINRTAARRLGRSPDTLTGKTLYDQLTPDLAKIRRAHVDRVIQTGMPERWEDERNGRVIDNSVYPVYSHDGKVVRLAVSGIDVTKHKRAEEELSAAKSQAELYLDLMGHDINNMHQIALGYLEIAEQIEDNEAMKELLERPRDVLLRSARLIDNVRKLQKLKDGAYVSRPVELVRVLSDVLQEYETVPGKDLALYTNGINCCHVMANELLYDVFSNLVSNAIKHSGARAEVAINLERMREFDCDYFRVSVEDNGPGIPDNFKEKVFNRMLRGDSKAKGMGLGLFIVKTLVDSYGGRVRVEDRVPGEHRMGAKVVVLLPALPID